MIDHQPLPTGDYQTRGDCRGCHSNQLLKFLDYGTVPLAGDFLKPNQVGRESVYPMDLSFCENCSLVQITNVVSADELFTDYRYLSSVTSTLMGHFRDYAEELEHRLSGKSNPLVVEFGCNDGVLLAPLSNLGVKAIGVDAAENVVALARGKGLDVHHGYFGAELAAQLRTDYGAADVITASNVFAHIDDLDNVMHGVDALLASDGTFSVEVHYVLDLVKTVQFETVYHEHLCYYSLKALTNLYKRFGLEITDAERLPMHGGAIRVSAQRSCESGGQKSDRLRQLLRDEEAAGLYTAEAYHRFGEAARLQRNAIRELVIGRKDAGRSICGYGAAGRATTLLSYCGLDHRVLDYVVDESPSRIGRYVPGVQVPIVTREHFHAHPTDDCLLTAWNYRDEILGKEVPYVQQGGVFLAPLPKIEVIQSDSPCLAVV